jgi:hypothetical protein
MPGRISSVPAIAPVAKLKRDDPEAYREGQREKTN